MSVFATFHQVEFVSSSSPRRRVRAVLAEVAGRLAASPLDHPVLSAVAAQRPACPPQRIRARWEAAVAADQAARHSDG
ncbi:hypothetical protein [Kitasatospora sp. HPMI-4]|uniref:hypothetical protein n=1 Tax=Kitasatospora sp. HPMI-4 TaxID=3448443 RepID=UPI003F1B7B44